MSTSELGRLDELSFVPSRLVMWGYAYGNLPSFNILALRILRQIFSFLKSPHSWIKRIREQGVQKNIRVSEDRNERKMEKKAAH